MMISVQELTDQIVTAAEHIDDFYEVEISVLIRTDGGRRSKFFRLNSEIPKIETNSMKIKAQHQCGLNGL